MLVVKDSSLAQSGKVNTEQVLFVGKDVTFPKLMLRLVQTEFDGLTASRIDGLDLDVPPLNNPALRLLIVEDQLKEALLKDYDSIRKQVGSVPIALAYRDPVMARPLLSLQQGQGALADLHFLPLNTPVIGWVALLRLMLSGERVVPGELVCPQAKPGPTPAPAPPPAANVSLTRREIEVLDRVALGQRNKTIADALGVSEHTVKLHIHHIIAKIGVTNRTGAANWYLARRNSEPDAQPGP